MGAVGQSSPAIRFGAFEVDVAGHQLRKNGSRIRLQEQPFQILTLLLERPGEVVTREQLRQKLWPSDTFVDFDHSLNTAVKKLRQALGDSVETPQFIETLPRIGYRLLVPINAHAVATATRPTTQPPPEVSARKPMLWLGIGGLVVAVAALLGYRLIRRTRTQDSDTQQKASIA